MKKLFLLLIVIAALSCAKTKPDFTKIKPGMKVEQVHELVGKPTDVQDIIFAKWLIYDEYIVAMVADTVNEVANKQQFMKEFEEGLKEFEEGMDAALKSLDESVESLNE